MMTQLGFIVHAIETEINNDIFQTALDFYFYIIWYAIAKTLRKHVFYQTISDGFI